ncbi:hypothetical protein L3D22_07500 [Lysobacter soli]|uniref:hypothetical protein n=1 Tax=Lysobacter soli TaxID=453783 RepID=UPI0020A07C07|nr:hypothetical protein [Lysobacter soli]UTA55636.1 hypothetical protein L3D22_07500 [Lysobacter soli]
MLVAILSDEVPTGIPANALVYDAVIYAYGLDGNTLQTGFLMMRHPSQAGAWAYMQALTQ